MAGVDPKEDAHDHDLTAEVPVGRSPTISYFTPEEVQHADTTEYHLHGAFRYALVVKRGPRAGMAFVLPSGSTQVGRDAECSMFLDDITVSRHHATFHLDEQRLTVVDHGSTNGTVVNGSAVENAELVAGDELILGKFHLMVVEGDG